MIKPMLCKLQDKPFNSQDYVWEQKWDGARVIAVVKSGNIRLFGRSGSEKTQLFTDLKIRTTFDCILDGEVVAGTSFNDMQHRIHRQSGISQAQKDYPAKFMVFDCLEIKGVDIRRSNLLKRKEALRIALVPTENVLLTPYDYDGLSLMDGIKSMGGEGVVGKNVAGIYRENARDWLKVKCWQEDIFYVRGFTQGTGWRASTFGSLVLGDGNGKFVGEVGTGFNEADTKSLFHFMMASPGTCPWSKEPVKATWTKPFTVKIKYLEYTNDGMLRFPVFKGIK